ncbi:CAMK/CAMK1 protein kinase [Aphanomyces invadans]|uniref:CAMK/CAMK1 protein kinase n=1 Tax=Aphanomyces invadans TaxID=157072 RepID=A0A024UKQ9_9STRA|nr:CAMK/CAMK1 protein kinase [Aphanomyces invadans]ETW06218.1 CAMK/CAMK1 protein kinase [Aphanomyces invadans]|eukprot:XP_008864293.1 CAMK/CAMK1 protein kinase [Aphanomyces invadans]
MATSRVHAATWVAVGVVAAAIVLYTTRKASSDGDGDHYSSKDISSLSSVSDVDKSTEQRQSSAAAAPPQLSFNDMYNLGKRLGSGAFAVVREGVHKGTGSKYAIKCIQTSSLSTADVQGLRQEIAILKQLSHPNIMSLHDVIEEPGMTYLVTEFIAGGELFDRIVEKTFYSENEARDLVRVLLVAIKYCHDHNVVHRDLKPENLLLTSHGDDASIKLADFGFAKLHGVDGLTTACGTPGYIAPEILQGAAYGKAVDIWSIGVITFILLCGYPPFHDDNPKHLFAAIKAGSYKFESPYWDGISATAKLFIAAMLEIDVAARATADDLLAHAWMVDTDVSTAPLGTVIEELKKFNHRRKFKAAVRTVQMTAALAKGVASVKSVAESSS